MKNPIIDVLARFGIKDAIQWLKDERVAGIPNEFWSDVIDTKAMKAFFHETWPQPLRISGQVCKWDSGSGNRCLIDSLLGMIDATKIDMFWGNGQDILLVNVESYDPSKKPDGICITVHDEAYALRETCVPAVFALLESWEDGSDLERAHKAREYLCDAVEQLLKKSEA